MVEIIRELASAGFQNLAFSLLAVLSAGGAFAVSLYGAGQMLLTLIVYPMLFAGSVIGNYLAMKFGHGYYAVGDLMQVTLAASAGMTLMLPFIFLLNRAMEARA